MPAAKADRTWRALKCQRREEECNRECGTQAGHTTTSRGCAEATDIADASVPDDPTCQLAAEKMFDTCTMPRCGSTEPPEQVSWRRSCATGTRRTRAGEAADHVAYMYSRDPPLLRLRLEPHRLRLNLNLPTPLRTGRETSGGSAGGQQTAGGASRPRPAELGTARSIPGG